MFKKLLTALALALAPATALAQSSPNLYYGQVLTPAQWNLIFMSKQGPVAWDSAFSAAIGGYPSGALVRSTIVATDFWISTTDNNVTNPDTGGAGWAAWGDGTGREQFRPTQESLYGWVVDNGTTIGNAASNATQRANADTQLLFAWYWNNFASLTIYTSGGAPTARGVSAAADYAANRAIATLTRQGMSVTGMDTMGGAATTKLASVPVTSGNATTAGSVLGENLHTLTIPELAEHDHTITTSASTIQVQVGTGTSVGAQVIAGQHVSMTGSNTPHNNVPLTQLGTWYRKL